MTDYMTSHEAARALGVAVSTIYRWSNVGRLDVHTYEVSGRRFRKVRRDSVEQLAADMGVTLQTTAQATAQVPAHGAEHGADLLPAWDQEIKPMPAALPGRDLSVREAAELLLWAIVRRYTR
jgi:excisionase family DNA binding protein